jgi:hypothetical protein
MNTWSIDSTGSLSLTFFIMVTIFPLATVHLSCHDKHQKDWEDIPSEKHQ